jgi:hypothetical protein
MRLSMSRPSRCRTLSRAADKKMIFPFGLRGTFSVACARACLAGRTSLQLRLSSTAAKRSSPTTTLRNKIYTRDAKFRCTPRFFPKESRTRLIRQVRRELFLSGRAAASGPTKRRSCDIIGEPADASNTDALCGASRACRSSCTWAEIWAAVPRSNQRGSSPGRRSATVTRGSDAGATSSASARGSKRR